MAQTTQEVAPKSVHKLSEYETFRKKAPNNCKRAATPGEGCIESTKDTCPMHGKCNLQNMALDQMAKDQAHAKITT
jgi:hypothetical protein